MAIACTISNERYSISIRQDRDILSYSANTYSVCRILSKNIYIYIYREVYDETRREYERGSIMVGKLED